MQIVVQFLPSTQKFPDHQMGVLFYNSYQFLSKALPLHH
nr:MAG TPA: hypothetical protein [Caudoviricetes sp.]